MTRGLTERQREVLDYVRSTCRRQGHAPTVQEIQEAFGFRSPNAAQTHIVALVKKRALLRTSRSPRSLEVIEGQDAGPSEMDAHAEPWPRPSLKPLTSRQRQVLDYIRRHLEEEGYAPTVKEIMEAFGFRSPNTVQSHVDALIRKGALIREGHSPRGLRLLTMPAQSSGQEHPELPRGRQSTRRKRSEATGLDSGPPAPEGRDQVYAYDQEVEMPLEVSFKAKHHTRGEFDGMMHAHSWRLQADVRVGKQAGLPANGVERLRDLVWNEVAELDGTVLNELDYFLGLEPSLENVAAWINQRLRARLTSLGLSLDALTLWDHPSESVTIRARPRVAMKSRATA